MSVQAIRKHVASASRGAIVVLVIVFASLNSAARAADWLPSWNDGPSKSQIVDFVQSVTDPRSKQYVPPAERIAVFDNDGTLWSEQPMYFQLAFILERVYGVPPEQVIGSSIRTRYEVRDGKPVILRLPEIEFIDDKAGKPVGIHRFIGRRPILAFGNSDGDFEMLEYTTSAPGPRLGLIVHHDDDEREYAYDRTSSVGRLARGLDEAGPRGWVVVSMKDDWRRVYDGGQR
jgi:hypothetical protein